MLIKRPADIPSSEITDKKTYLNRRDFIRAATGTAAVAAAGIVGAEALLEAQPPAPHGAKLANVKPSAFSTTEKPNTWEQITTYNNYYEFGTDKDQPAYNAHTLRPSPWSVMIEGEVAKPASWQLEDILKGETLEDRIYRHRCVEAWSMAVPWTGFPMAALVDMARPLGSAKYVRMETFMDPATAPEQKKFFYPWPYVEGLTMAEARNELTFLATGMYGKPMPKQDGAPIRLVTPWKYGFKSIKSIVRFEFTDKRPKGYWEALQPSEYGFWANVNPAVPHPRWSQASERVLGADERKPTLIWNGYGEFVAPLYQGLEKERLFV
jgi:methionine sulfoxide reductase catalytic subunit